MNDDTDVHIIATMSTFRERKEQLKDSVNSIIDQVNHLYLYLNDYTDVTGVLSYNPKITVIIGKYSFGDIMDTGKFAMFKGGWITPTPEVKTTMIIFTLDDDLIYPANYTETMIKALRMRKMKCAVGIHGSNIIDPTSFSDYKKDRKVYHFSEQLDHEQDVDMIGTGTLAFPLDIIPSDADLWSAFKTHGMCDLWFSVFCKTNNIKMICCHRLSGWIKSLTHTRSTALYRRNNILISKTIKTILCPLIHDDNKKKKRQQQRIDAPKIIQCNKVTDAPIKKPNTTNIPSTTTVTRLVTKRSDRLVSRKNKKLQTSSTKQTYINNTSIHKIKPVEQSVPVSGTSITKFEYQINMHRQPIFRLGPFPDDMYNLTSIFE